MIFRFFSALGILCLRFSRASSFAGAFPNSGSLGRTDARRVHSHEFNKYAEEPDEDYEDVFGKVNGNRKSPLANSLTDIDTVLPAADHTTQTLQLNTRLSNKSWVTIINSLP